METWLHFFSIFHCYSCSFVWGLSLCLLFHLLLLSLWRSTTFSFAPNVLKFHNVVFQCSPYSFILFWAPSGPFQSRNSCDSVLGVITWSCPIFCLLFFSFTPITYLFHCSKLVLYIFSVFSVFHVSSLFCSWFWIIPNFTNQIYWVFNFSYNNFFVIKIYKCL